MRNFFYFTADSMKRTQSRKQSRGFFRRLLLMSISLIITVFILSSIAYLYLDSQLPDVQALKDVQLPIPLRVYTNDGQLLAEFGELRRNPVKFNQVPPLLVKAILATEDQRYYEHSGVDIWGLLRAAGELVATGTKAQGGSTITMQVARNFYLTRKKTFVRKLTEIMLALKIEREFTKDEILELYLNKIYLGNRAYGVAAAAQIYYGKTLDQLTLPEMAMIAGLPKAPSTINPIVNPVGAKDRRNHVLDRMYDQGYIDKKTYDAAVNAPISATFHGETIPVRAPYVAEMVRDMMVTSFGDDAYTKGYSVYTTIDTQQQIMANQALRDALLSYDRRHGYRGSKQNLGTPNSKNKDEWLSALDDISSVNGLQPAAVLTVSSNSATALLKNSDIITIPWSGLSWAKRELGNGRVSVMPKKAGNVVKVGDVIRVQQLPDGSWQLAEVPQIEGALVALNPQNGAITSLVGGFDFERSKYNRVIQMQRQPGSSFKPYIYAAALAKGYTLASVFDDAPMTFYIPGQPAWHPQNDKNEFFGPSRLRFALAHSINLVTIRVLQAIGVPYALKYISRFGFDPNKLPRNLTLALGSGEITPLDHARGYAVFANGGYRVTPYFIDHVTDNQGNVVFQSQPKIACAACITTNALPPNTDAYAPQAIPPQIAFLMTSALQEVIRSGTGFAAKVLNRTDLAGKTGTTNDKIDSWFAGFNSDIVAVAWVGFDQPQSIYEYGAQAALPMWIDFMRVALQGKPEHTMAKPPGIETMNIDPATGFLSAGGIPEYFDKENLPQQQGAPTATPTTDDSGNNGSDPLF
jgi:penicillin-binding protein 1A